jgi:hypothetical protein
VSGLDESEVEQLLDGLAIDLSGPLPVEVGHGFHCADVRVARTSLEAALLALALLDGEDLAEPGLVDDLIAARDEAEQAESLEAIFQLHGREINGHVCRPF